MSNPTTPFGWQMPTNTDLVTDLPADFEVFGQAVATSMADLLGGTTGQVLSKNSNTDMDFVWTDANPGDITGVTAGTGISGGGTSGTVTITNSMATTITTAGDLIKGTGSGTFDRLGIGSTGQVLTVSGGAPVWATPAGGGKILQVVSTFKSDAYTTSPNVPSYTDVTGLSVSITPSSTSSRILVLYNVAGESQSGVSAAFFRLVRGSTAIDQGDAAGSRTLGFGNTYQPSATDTVLQLAGTYVDSPATTSSTTYKIQVTCGGVLYINRSQSDSNAGYGMRVGSSITVMEIGA